MTAFLTVLHVIVCVFMIAVILLQRGKGAEMGAVFGGGASATVFGGRGAGNFLTKLTTASAVIFMGTSLSLAYLASQDDDGLFSDVEVEGVAGELGGALPSEAADSGLGEFEEIEAPAAPESPAEAPNPGGDAASGTSTP